MPTIWGILESTPRKIAVVFYRTPARAEVVRDWLRDLDEADRNIIGQDLIRVQFRWPVGMPLCRPLGEKQPFQQPDCAGVFLFYRGSPSRAPRHYQKTPKNAAS